MRICAAIMVRNMAPFIGATIRSLSWVDGIYVYDDNSTDGTGDVASSFSRVPIIVERANNPCSAFERGQVKVRNYILDQTFKKFRCDVLISIDGDELISNKTHDLIRAFWGDRNYDSISLSMWHLYDERRYLHFWEKRHRGVNLIDPHTRIIIKGKYFEDIFGDGNHPAICATGKTLFIHGPYHFHLKYFYKSPYPNYALDFLPQRLTPEAVNPYLRNIPFSLPRDIKEAISVVKWDILVQQETYYYEVYLRNRKP